MGIFGVKVSILDLVPTGLLKGSSDGPELLTGTKSSVGSSSS